MAPAPTFFWFLYAKFYGNLRGIIFGIFLAAIKRPIFLPYASKKLDELLDELLDKLMNLSAIKRFNISGPSCPTEHYMLPPLLRQTEVKAMIEDKYYFVLRAPHHSGKTTFLFALTDAINSQGDYYALRCSLMTLIDIKDSQKALASIVDVINYTMYTSQVQSIKNKAYAYNSLPEMANSSAKVSVLFNKLCEDLDKDLIVFFDEVEYLSGPGLITFLAQIRRSYQIRDKFGAKFPRSMAFVGQRDIRDCLAQALTNSTSSKGLCSPFNIIKETLTLPNFTRDEIKIIYDQHTEASGQEFSDKAIDLAWHWSEGQPRLVNDLAYDSVVNILKRDYSRPITSDIMEQAAQNLIKHQENHLDYIQMQLFRPRVRAVMDPIIIGADFIPLNVPLEDIRYAEELGILKNTDGIYQPANPIYNEVIVRSLSQPFEWLFNNEAALARSNLWIDGQKLAMTSTLKAFQKYWRKNSEIFEEFYGYNETLPLLVLNAFLLRILSSAVKFAYREFFLGKWGIDLNIEYMGQVYPLALKIKAHKSRPDSLALIKDYMDICGAKEGWLVIFDSKSKKSWDEKITWQTTQYEGSTIHIVGC
jgi:hypothetical protein